jgi:hypothetical protein
MPLREFGEADVRFESLSCRDRPYSWCPQYSQKLPRLLPTGVSAMGQKRTHALQRKCAYKDRIATVFQKSDQVFYWAAIADDFRFLRQPSKPIAPKPVAKRGRAVGRGVSAI